MAEDFNTRVINEFHANDGRVGPPFEGAPMILVHHIGARSGQERVTPLVWFADDENMIIVASAAGAPKDPAWFGNLKANPEVTVEVSPSGGGARTLTVRAEEITGSERDAWWERVTAASPGFADYATKTAGIRTIPLVRLTPAD